MEQLLNGRFDYEVPKLLLSKPEITGQTMAGENFRGDLYLRAEDGRKIKGFAFSSHRRFLLGKEHFSGDSIHIPYGLDVKGLQSGDVCKGEITCSTDIGEYKIPFCILIEEKQVRTSSGEICDIDAFVGLAKTDYREAFHLYLDEAFQNLLSKEEDLRPYYQGMHKNPVTYQHLEEFLIGIGKKEPVFISLDQTDLELYEVKTSLKDTIAVKRSTWGYIRIEVSVAGDFLEVQKQVITSEDFIGSVYDLEIIIRKDRIGKGKNYGRIFLKTVYETRIFEIVVSKNSKVQVKPCSYEKSKKAALARDYLALCTHHMAYRTWKEKSLQVLADMKDRGYFSLEYELLEAYIYYTAEENEKANAILNKVEAASGIKENPVLEGYTLYIAKLTGKNPNENQKMLEKLHRLYQKNEDNFWLLWILLREDEKLCQTPVGKLHMLEHQYEIGCRSPFLYIEALRVLSKNGGLLRKINPFYMQVLIFAKRNELFTEEIAARAAYISGYVKVFSPMLYEIMAYAYKQYPSKELLDAICKFIMKGNPEKKEYFIWYELAVEQELRITRLYEYYIETMGRNYQKMLPTVIRMYFTYNNTLSEKKKAFIYSNVIHNKEIDKDTYQSYKEAMKAFAWERLTEGKVNEDFAVLYQEFCMLPKDSDQQAALAQILFIHRLYLEDAKIRRVIVCHDALLKEESYPCSDGVAYISLYTKDAKIIFEDDKQRRYIGTVDFNLQKLLDKQETADLLLESQIDDYRFLLSVCGELSHENPITEDTIVCYQKVLTNDAFCIEYQNKIRQRLLKYYQTHMETEDLKDYLKQLDFHGFAKVNKSLLIDILVNQGMYIGAYDLLCEYGYEEIKTENLLQLCNRMILNLEFAYEEELVLLAHYIFSLGKYNDVIIRYLCMQYEGPAEEMAAIWESAQGLQMEAYEVEEKILCLCMFTRIYLPKAVRILDSYSKQAGKEQLILAYLTYEAYGYFVGGKATDLLIFKYLEKAVQKAWEMDIVCKLALLRYYAELTNWSDMQQDLLRRLLKECSDQGFRFAFYQKFPVKYLSAFQLEDKVFAEYQTSPGANVTLFYQLHGREEPLGEYHREPLKDIFQGFFSKEFILFYGECLTYYFTVENDGAAIQTEPKTVTMETAGMWGNTKYQLINRMLKARTTEEDMVFQELLEQYLEQEALINRMFRIME